MISGQCLDKGIEYQCHISPDIADCYVGDNMKIRQVLINILGNAVKFTPSGGKIEFDVDKKAQFDGKTTLQFTMKDNGIGISEEFLPKIFEPFAQEDNSSTNKFGSSGLGLAITKNIVEIMNGDIRVESRKGEGAAFTVTLTLDDSKGQSETCKFEMEPGDIKVLIVDDDPIACEHAKLVLEKAGIASETVISGAEAIELVKLRQARQDPYNLILVDWQMPDMDGVETTRRIREIAGNDSAIIILTAYKWDDIFDEAVKAGVDRFLPKPLFASSVMEEFRSALASKRNDDDRNSEPVVFKDKRILLAEDVPINAEIMMMILSSQEINVDLAENGKIAVDLFEQHEEGYYDAILMDMRMPEMDGLEATRVIRAMGRKDSKDIPIIALTANAFDEDVQRSLQAGLNAHLSKPVQPEALFKTLAKYIRQKG
jgi:CheY-like chemotaxis protein